MLTVSGLKNFYFLPHFHDMRCGYARIMEIIHLQQTIDAQGERLSIMQLTLDKIESALHATHDENTKLNAQLSLQGVSRRTCELQLGR